MIKSGKDIVLHANGINICYNDLGNGDMPVVFIHGFPFDKSMWDSQLKFLSPHYRTISFDIRGYGKTTSGQEAATISLYADDLVDFLDLLQIEKCVGCGLSMGGYILLDAVTRYPERFKALILSDTQCQADTDEAREKRFKTIDLISKEGTAAFAEGFVKNIFCETSLQNKKEIIEEIKQVILNTSPGTIIATLKALAGRVERCSDLASIAIPTLVLCGKEDKVTPVDRSQLLQEGIRGSELAIIDGAGHMANLEQPEMFNQRVNAFLKKMGL